jgi:asparagine synthase (glutamine-hydrolysing)
MCGIFGVFGSEVDVHEHVPACYKIHHRGTDCFKFESIIHYPNCAFGFHRLAFLDSLNGMQPIRIVTMPHIWVICNGEIYNYKELQKKYQFNCITSCDIELLIHLYNKGGIEFMCENLNGEFAFILFDSKTRKVFLGRDTFGVRPLFKTYLDNNMLAACSEAKGLIDVKFKNGAKKPFITPVLPGSFEEYELDAIDSSRKPTFIRSLKFHVIGDAPKYDVNDVTLTDDVYANIRSTLENAVQMRLMSERRIGCLLSGGLDSSLLAGLMVQEAKKAGIHYPIQTFTIGMDLDSPDIISARKVADFLHTEHHEVFFNPLEAFECIPAVIKSVESYDIHTIRASIGMYLISKYIQEHADTAAVFTGDGADEVCQGYLYFAKAPNAQCLHEEAIRLCNDIHLYDLTRADRTTASGKLELRCPFLDHTFSSYYLSLPAKDRMTTPKRCEKYLLRKAYEGLNVIPQDILWRPKEGFSDGVATPTKSLFKILQNFADKQVTDEEFANASKKYPFNTPVSKEGIYYRKIFEDIYPNCETFVPYMWLPKWCGLHPDPSARTLEHYKERQEAPHLNENLVC